MTTGDQQSSMRNGGGGETTGAAEAAEADQDQGPADQDQQKQDKDKDNDEEREKLLAVEKEESKKKKKLVLVDAETLEREFGAGLEDVYRTAIRFYRDKNDKAFHLSYEDRNKLVAYTKQVAHGSRRTTATDSDHLANTTQAGFFDLIGNDRMQAWEALGDLSKADSMAGFVSLLDSVCPQFRVYMEAQKRDLEERKKIELAEEERRKVKSEEEHRQQEEESRQRSEEQRRQIQEALNRQTYPQFRVYAEQQFPNSPDQQHALIRQLQEQHFEQYMAQVYSQQEMIPEQRMDQNHQEHHHHQQPANDQHHQGAPLQQSPQSDYNNTSAPATITGTIAEGQQQQQPVVAENGGGGGGAGSDGEETESGGEEDVPSNPAISPASMWTRKDMKEFKEAIRKEGTEGVIKVGHGETVTVRVPTHDEGTCLFWEFATDYYDIGFGVYFEWTISETNTVSVHISESDEEDEEDYDPDNANGKGGDLEKGGKTSEKESGKPQQDEIIPVYRRDCHEEVYAGSHVYPCKGVYLLKFDNSYSLWRSKKLYYRVYYSK